MTDQNIEPQAKRIKDQAAGSTRLRVGLFLIPVLSEPPLIFRSSARMPFL